MKPPDEESRKLTCIRDQASVSAQDPRCLHPSSVCEFREFCEVIDEIRQRRRAESSGENVSE